MSVEERKLTPSEKRKLKRYEKETPKKDFTDRYGKKKGEDIYYATLTKMAKKGKKKVDEMFSTSGTKGYFRIQIRSGEEEHAGHVERSQHQGLQNVMQDQLELEAKAFHWDEPDWHYDGGYGDPEGPDSKWYLGEEELEEKKDPKVGTGKKPKGSGRRLYTDEDPSDTVPVEFSSVAAIKRTLAKSTFKSKSHKRQSQIINLIHQRARAAYKNAKDPKVKARLKKAFEYAEERKEASKKKTKAKQKKNESLFRLIKEELNAMEVENLIGVSDLEYIASGKFGNVYKGNHPEFGVVAVKILSSETGNQPGSADTMKIQQEISNYENVGIAVDANDQVAKHFPKVYEGGMKIIDDGILGYVIMELVKPSPYSQEIVNSLFAGLEYYLQRDNLGFNEPLPLSDEPQLQDREVSVDRRVENVFLHNIEQVKDMIADLYQGLMSELNWSAMGPEEVKLAQGFRDAVIGVFYNYFVNIDRISDDAMITRYNIAKNNVLETFPRAARAIDNTERVINSDYGDRMVPKLGIMAVIASIVEVIDRLPYREDMVSEIIMMIEDAVQYPRQFTVIPTGYYSSTLDNTAGGRREDMPEAAKSLERSFLALRNEVGLVPRDLHSLNVMVKDDTGEIVIIDFGNFSQVS
jgi:serine/threonine protein kinase